MKGNKINDNAMIIIFTLNKVNKLELTSPKEAPSKSFFELEVAKSKIGMIIGNPRMAISIELFSAFEARADTMVNAEANPILPRIRLIKNHPSIFGNPRKIPKIRNVNITKIS